MPQRRGFALMTVLWIMVAAAIAAMSATLSARDNADASRNRIDLERAIWRARGCLDRARATIDVALAQSRSAGSPMRVWRELDREIGHPEAGGPCNATLEAAGTRIDINAADSSRLAALFFSLGLHDDLAALVITTRNATGGFADVRQLGQFVDSQTLVTLSHVLDVEPGRVAVNSAPASVLAVIPGFTQDIVDHILARRSNGEPVADLLALSASVSPEATRSVIAHFQEIVPFATVNPDAWVLTARGRAGSPPLEVTIDTRLALDGYRTVVTRYRSRP